MLAEITKNNADNFKALVPRIELQRLEKDEDRFGIGYMDDPDGFPDGVLLFKLDMEPDEEDELHPIAEISYFYVREEARDMYVGTYLFSTLIELSEDTGIEALKCDVPMGFEYNLLCNVLENYGFDFSLTEVFEFERPLKDFMDSPHLKNASEVDVMPLYEVPPKAFATVMEAFIKNEKYADYDLSYDMEYYETELSTLVVEGNKITAMFLVKMDEEGRIVPVLIWSGKNSSDVYSGMIVEAVDAAFGKYGKKAIVKITIHNRLSLRLIERLFEDFKPYLVRRGYFYI